jgi:hypothetical protein
MLAKLEYGDEKALVPKESQSVSNRSSFNGSKYGFE